MKPKTTYKRVKACGFQYEHHVGNIKVFLCHCGKNDKCPKYLKAVKDYPLPKDFKEIVALPKALKASKKNI